MARQQTMQKKEEGSRKITTEMRKPSETLSGTWDVEKGKNGRRSLYLKWTKALKS